MLTAGSRLLRINGVLSDNRSCLEPCRNVSYDGAMESKTRDLKLLLKNASNTFNPETVDLADFSKIISALSALFTSLATANGINQQDDMPLARFKAVRKSSLAVQITATEPMAVLADQFCDAVAGNAFSEVSHEVLESASEFQKLTSSLKVVWTFKTGTRSVTVPEDMEFVGKRATFSFTTSQFAIFTKGGGKTSFGHFELSDGRSLSLTVPRELWPKLEMYRPYMLQGTATADADSLEIVDIKIEDIEPIVEESLDEVLSELASLATKKFVQTPISELSLD